MKLVILQTGKIEEYDNSYAVRLIEQGKAIPAPAIEEVKSKHKNAGDK